MQVIDINCDMGETKAGCENLDQQFMPFISSCNVACGFHAGDPFNIESTIRAAIDHKIKIGAHPSYKDSENFGRISLDTSLEILIPQLRYQISAVKGMVESLGAKLNHVKAHGALYNDISLSSDLARAFVKLVQEIDPKLKIYGLSGSILKEICKEEEMVFVAETFADRKYENITQLRSRALEGAVLKDEKQVLEQVSLLLSGKVKLYSGDIEKIHTESICIHSDTPDALALCKAINHLMKTNNIEIA